MILKSAGINMKLSIRCIVIGISIVRTLQNIICIDSRFSMCHLGNNYSTLPHILNKKKSIDHSNQLKNSQDILLDISDTASLSQRDKCQWDRIVNMHFQESGTNQLHSRRYCMGFHQLKRFHLGIRCNTNFHIRSQPQSCKMYSFG